MRTTALRHAISGQSAAMDGKRPCATSASAPLPFTVLKMMSTILLAALSATYQAKVHMTASTTATRGPSSPGTTRREALRAALSARSGMTPSQTAILPVQSRRSPHTPAQLPVYREIPKSQAASGRRQAAPPARITGITSPMRLSRWIPAAQPLTPPA
ncbi:hypothetical protein SDC9_80798 [bioreactor metagenome]|uniref:Uncharacterized protein n=1 Tax=bioreactor metagenome TaxID=1076179 RepID=A0A644Z061_9ZZZZ